MHDGLYGRPHLYSYVNDNGTWWKTVDWDVTEASCRPLSPKAPPLFVLSQVPEETVLTDPTGFHLGAGPYMLSYSRAIPEGDPEPLQWPEDVVVRAQPIFFLSSGRPHNCTFPRQRAVQLNNQLFLKRFTQDDTSGTVEMSIPSSTSASRFTTPMEGPITPGDTMDVSN